MYKLVEIGRYFAPGDLSSSYKDNKKYSNMNEEHETDIICYVDSTKTKTRTDMKYVDGLTYIHGSADSTANPYFETAVNNNLPFSIHFNMRFTRIMGELGDKEWFFVYDGNVSNGAIGLKHVDIEDGKLVSCFVDGTGTIVCPVNEGIGEGEWFKVTLLYYQQSLCMSVNDYMIGSVAWGGDLQNKFQMLLKSSIFYIDYSDIVISRVISVPAPDKPFDITHTIGTITNGATTVIAKATEISQD